MAFPQLFNRRSTGKKDHSGCVPRAEFEALEAKCDRVESQMLLIKTEWNDVYDKVSHLYDRTRKRIKALKSAEERAEAPNPAPNGPEPSSPKTHAEILKYARERGQL